MAQFNLADYETVEERIRRFYADHPQGRIITKNKTTPTDRAVSTWVVKAEIWLPITYTEESFNARFMEQAYLKATGWAFEIDGVGMANKTSALENAETSAIGRALANAGYSGNKRASREEMSKVARAEAATRDWLSETKGKDLDGLRQLFQEARIAKAPGDVLDKIKILADELKG